MHLTLLDNALQGTAADWLWLLPLLPLLGFVLNGLLSLIGAYHAGPADPSADGHDTAHDEAHADGGHDAGAHAAARHPFAGAVSVIGPGVLIAAFGLAAAIWLAMLERGELLAKLGRGELLTPVVQHYYTWMPVGALSIDFAFQLDQL